MADGELDVLELEDQISDDADDDAEDEGEEQGAPDTSDETDELQVQFDDEAAPASGERDSALVKHLREVIRRKDEQITQGGKTETIEVGPKPDLWDDCEGDQDRFEAALLAWNQRKEQAAAQNAQAAQAQEEVQKQWQDDLNAYREKEALLKAPDMDLAKDVVTNTLSLAQQATIIQASGNPALVVYALGKHPAKLAAISQITNPIKLAAEIARMEGKITMAKRQAAPAVERVAAGSASIGSGDKRLAALKAKAEKTGDYSEYLAAKRGG